MLNDRYIHGQAGGPISDLRSQIPDLRFLVTWFITGPLWDLGSEIDGGLTRFFPRHYYPRH